MMFVLVLENDRAMHDQSYCRLEEPGSMILVMEMEPMTSSSLKKCTLSSFSRRARM